MIQKIKLRNGLNADVLFSQIRSEFEKIPDHRSKNRKISLPDALMSGFAMFSLKDPSLLAFDQRQSNDTNLKSIYNIENVPCDTQMRTILDDVDPVDIEFPFNDIFHKLQRGKVLEPMVFMNRSYLSKIHCSFLEVCL